MFQNKKSQKDKVPPQIVLFIFSNYLCFKNVQLLLIDQNRLSLILKIQRKSHPCIRFRDTMYVYESCLLGVQNFGFIIFVRGRVDLPFLKVDSKPPYVRRLGVCPPLCTFFIIYVKALGCSLAPYTPRVIKIILNNPKIQKPKH